MVRNQRFKAIDFKHGQPTVRGSHAPSSKAHKAAQVVISWSCFCFSPSMSFTSSRSQKRKLGKCFDRVSLVYARARPQHLRTTNHALCISMTVTEAGNFFLSFNLNVGWFGKENREWHEDLQLQVNFSRLTPNLI